MKLANALLVLAVTLAPGVVGADAPQRSTKEALQAFNDLIGSWRGTAVPGGSSEDQRRGFWTETINWQWQFKGQDAWLKVDFDKSKQFQSGTLRYLPEKDLYQLTVLTPAKETQTFTGQLAKRVLTLQREAPEEKQRLIVTLLHANRFLYRYEVQPKGKSLYSMRFKVGATKEGVPFAAGDGKPECIVSGGLGTIPVSFNGVTYYVCCSGCKEAFNENPAKFVKEWEAKKGKK